MKSILNESDEDLHDAIYSNMVGECPSSLLNNPRLKIISRIKPLLPTQMGFLKISVVVAVL